MTATDRVTSRAAPEDRAPFGFLSLPEPSTAGVHSSGIPSNCVEVVDNNIPVLTSALSRRPARMQENACTGMWTHARTFTRLVWLPIFF